MTTKLSPFILWIGAISFSLLNLLNAAPWRSQTIPEKVPPSIVKSDRSSWGVKNGFFGGIGIGAGMMLFSTPNMNNNKGGSAVDTLNVEGNASAQDALLALDYSAKLGAQLYLTPYIGARAYISYVGGSGFPSGGGESSLYYLNHSADFNLDFLIEIAQTYRSSFGLVGGVSVGYNIFYRNQTGSNSFRTSSDGNDYGSIVSYSAGKESKGSYMFGLNLGVGLTMFRRHRFDVIAKIPIMPLDSDMNIAGIYRGNLYLNNGGGETEEIYYRYVSVNVSYSFIY